MSPIKRVVFSAFIVVFTWGTILAPAHALLPVVGAVGGIVLRGAAGGVAKRIFVPLARGANQPNKFTTATNALFGLFVATIALSDGDENEKLYLRPRKGVNETAEPTPGTDESYPAVTAWRVSTGGPSCAYVSGYTFSTADIACASVSSDQGWQRSANMCPPYPNGGTGAWVFDYRDGSSCKGTRDGDGFSGGNFFLNNPEANASGGVVDSSLACPSGGTLTGSTCVKLSEPTCPPDKVLNDAGTLCETPFPADGIQTHRSDSGELVPEGLDPDLATQIAAPYTWDGFDQYGNRVRIKVTPTTAGGLKIETFTQGTTPNGDPSVIKNTLTTDEDGKLDPPQSEEYPGTIDDVDTPTPPDPNVTVKIDLPTDYAREPTTQQIRDNTAAIDTTMKEIRDGLKGDPTGAFEPATTAAQAAEDALKAVPDQVVGDKASTAWGFTLALPTGCTNPPAIVFPKWSIDPDLCQHQGIIHTAMSFPWAFLTLTVCVGLVRRTLG